MIDRTCRAHAGKRRYGSVEAARHAGQAITRRQGEYVRPYVCPGCRRIFLGHEEPGHWAKA